MPSDLQRNYRAVLDGAKEQRQIVRDTDGSLLAIGPLEDVDFEHRLVGHQSDVAQFMAVRKANASRPLSEWAHQTPYPWIAPLSSEDLDEFQSELVRACFSAAHEGSVEHLEGALAAWKSTAEINADPEQLAALMAPDLDIAEVFPPSEEQVERAGGGS